MRTFEIHADGDRKETITLDMPSVGWLESAGWMWDDVVES